MKQLLAPLLLVAALSLDAFVAALGCGAEKIRIPAVSLWIVSLICSAALSLSLWAGSLLAALLPGGSPKAWGCGLLALLGVFKLAEAPLSRLRRPADGGDTGAAASLASIYRQPTRADRDGSRSLSPGEAAALAVALSADGAAAGIGAGAVAIGALPVFFLSAAVHLAGIRLGEAAGRRLARALSFPPAPACGVLLLLLALGRLFG